MYVFKYSSFSYSFHANDQDDVCFNWILLYVLDIVLPLLLMLGVAGMILRKNGKDLYREIWFPILLKTCYQRVVDKKNVMQSKRALMNLSVVATLPVYNVNTV